MRSGSITKPAALIFDTSATTAIPAAKISRGISRDTNINYTVRIAPTLDLAAIRAMLALRAKVSAAISAPALQQNREAAASPTRAGIGSTAFPGYDLPSLAGESCQCT